MKKSTSIVKTVIIIIMALVIALDTVFIFILSNSINAVDQRVTEQEVNDVYVATLLMDKDICSKKDYVTDVIKEYSTIITDRPYILLINPDLKPVLKEILKENSDIVENNPSFKVIFPSILLNTLSP